MLIPSAITVMGSPRRKRRIRLRSGKLRSGRYGSERSSADAGRRSARSASSDIVSRATRTWGAVLAEATLRSQMAATLSASLRGSRPNFVLFNVDDTGFGDWSWNLHGAAKHAASDGGVDTPHTAALVRAPSGMHARPAAHRPSPLRLVARRIGRRLLAMRAPCHPTLPPLPADGSLPPTRHHPFPCLVQRARGLRLTDFHAGSSVCTPSRAALMTGRHGLRTG